MSPTRHLVTEPEVERLRRLTEIGRALTYTTSVEQVARLTVERGAGLFGTAAAVLMLPDGDGQLHVRATHGVSEPLVARFRAPADDDVAERLRGLLGVPDDFFVAVPLVAGGAVTGLVAAALDHVATSSDEWLLSALADQSAVALENARLGFEGRVEMEERLRASEGAMDAKDRALATLAHDIRAPLGAIDGYCWNMEDAIYGPVSEQQRVVLGRVRMSGRHLLSLLDNVMDMARLNAGAMVLLAEPVRLADVAREAVEILAPASAAKRQRLELAGTPDAVVTGDRARLRQVLVNLLGNAVKFTPPEGTVTITTTNSRAGERAWGEARVADTGPGIAEAERSAVFEPYYRSADTARAPGVGLGLAISRGLVTQMGGELELESEVGIGSAFTIRLPSCGAPAASGSTAPGDGRAITAATR